MGMKQTVLARLRAAGYDVRRVEDPADDLEMYRRVYSADSLARKAFYNIGAGSFSHPYWTNVDHPSGWYGDAQGDRVHIAWDAESGEPLPIPDGSAEIFYTSHTVEHLTDDAVGALFGEAYRCLKPDGTFRITTPDMDLEYQAFVSGDRDFFYWKDWYIEPAAIERAVLSGPMSEASIEQLFLHHFASSVSTLHGDSTDEKVTDDEVRRVFAELPRDEAFNHLTNKTSREVQARYPGGHVNWWTRPRQRGSWRPPASRTSGAPDTGKAWRRRCGTPSCSTPPTRRCRSTSRSPADASPALVLP
jgi:predicted SAM-dependent methyltransferase